MSYMRDSNGRRLDSIAIPSEDEVTDAIAVETSARAAAVSAEVLARANADVTLASAIVAEATSRDAAIAAAIDDLLGGAPGALDTLNELAAALGDDANFAASVNTALAGKASTSDLTTEATARANADTTLQTNITAEAAARAAADTAEATARDTAIAAKPRLQPNTVALLGDSITYFNGSGAGVYDTPVTVPYHHSQGFFTWANIALGGRLTLTRQAGVAGNTSAQVLARITDITGLAVMPGYCVVMAGTNDMLNGVASATTIANLTAIHDALIAKGITVVACTMPYVWSATSAYLLAQAEVNDWIRDQATKPGIIVCDWAGRFANDNGDGTPKTGYTTDGVHPTPVGAAILGRQLADAIRFRVAGSPLGLASTNIEPTNALANGLMIGTSGTLNTGAAGSFATSWIAGRTAGTGTITGSKVARVDGMPGSWQQLSISGSSGATFLMYQDVSPAGIAPGHKYIAEMEFEGFVPTDIKKFTLTLAQVGAGGAGGYALAEASGATLVYPSEIPAGVMRTPVVTLNGTPTGLRTSVDLIGTDGSVRVARIRLRRVA